VAGETTTDLVSNSIPLLVSKSVGQVVAQPWSVEARTSDLATNDITAVAKIPAGSTYLGCFLITDDLDTNGSVALVWSILVGATAVNTAIGNDTAIVGAFYASAVGPVTVTADTFINMKATTAAGTAAAGTIALTPVYITSA
jgi:hypothetical protein